MDEQLKIIHTVVDVVDRPYRKLCVSLLRYSVDKPESSNAQVGLFATMKEDEKFQQVVWESYKLEEIIYLLGVMNSGYDKINSNNLNWNFQEKVIGTIHPISFFFLSE